MRIAPSTVWVSLERASRLSRERAFVTSLPACLRVLDRSRPRRIEAAARRRPGRTRPPGSLPGEAGHLRAVLAHRAQHDALLLACGEAELASRDQEAGRQPLHIPLPRPGQRLVEVVDVEHESPLRRGEDAEVREVGVPAALHLKARARRAGEVGGHDRRRAAVERERRGQHAAVADRDELRRARRGLRLEHVDRIAAAPPNTSRDWSAARLRAPRARAQPALQRFRRRSRCSVQRRTKRAVSTGTPSGGGVAGLLATAMGFSPSIRRIRLRACG